MALPHAEHFARKKHQDKIGIFSYHLIRCPQFGHDDAGDKRLPPLGRRQMQTFRKLPIQVPKINIKNENSPKALSA
jgi:hypothetical protein